MDYEQILKDSFEVTKIIVGKSWKKVKPYAETEFKKFAENAEDLAKLKLLGEISEEELKQRIIIQRTSLSNVLIAIQGIALVTAQDVVNAVLGIVSKAIFTALKVVLPI
ncbi:hypothetical protein CNR22_18365 [Sphingobacteriaceae bacterium]|nr:hypothetical protein CNR22_18365 [Sphingobacteriaceae bacterium]